MVGKLDGVEVGLAVGEAEGHDVGVIDGCPLGSLVGIRVGVLEGCPVGVKQYG